ncbi:hypothetical protein ACFSJY_06440 [Thalassotalea euphylliae]|uniref:hypothetical protein n=1 Tax=Thalassotalea euphylliae TaxID=1655234 RepID=UPI003638E429
MINRRKFLVASAVSAVAIGSNKIFAATSFAQTSNKDDAIARYQKKVGDSFYLRAEGISSKVTLAELRDVKEDKQTQQFTLVFETNDSDISEGLCSATHLKSFDSEFIRVEQSNSEKGKLISTFCLLK